MNQGDLIRFRSFYSDVGTFPSYIRALRSVFPDSPTDYRKHIKNKDMLKIVSEVNKEKELEIIADMYMTGIQAQDPKSLKDVLLFINPNAFKVSKTAKQEETEQEAEVSSILDMKEIPEIRGIKDESSSDGVIIN